jgi:hypothetical protein
MASPIPSREALRALSRLCRRDIAPLRHYITTTRSSPLLPIRCSTQLRRHLPTISNIQSTRRKSATSDPQHESSAALPDITNFYSLKRSRMVPPSLPRASQTQTQSYQANNPDPTFTLIHANSAKNFYNFKASIIRTSTQLVRPLINAHTHSAHS